jgi:hypothetical protein
MEPSLIFWFQNALTFWSIRELDMSTCLEFYPTLDTARERAEEFTLRSTRGVRAA